LKLKTLPGVQQRLDSARKAPGTKLDSAALSQRINAARSAISAAENTLAAGKSDTALQQAQSVQKQLADLDRLISDAASASGGGDSGDQKRGNDRGQGNN
jgi:hypothetical protein